VTKETPLSSRARRIRQISHIVKRSDTKPDTAAAKRIRATGYPDSGELLQRLAADDPSVAEEASALFERAATKNE